jgi:hypothetical protein
MNRLVSLSAVPAPAFVAAVSARASYRFLEFFTAQIRGYRDIGDTCRDIGDTCIFHINTRCEINREICMCHRIPPYSHGAAWMAGSSQVEPGHYGFGRCSAFCSRPNQNLYPILAPTCVRPGLMWVQRLACEMCSMLAMRSQCSVNW